MAHERVEINPVGDPDDRHNIPPRPALFVDRENEIQQITHELLHGRAIVIGLVGPGGIGKTSLALEIVHRLAEESEFKSHITWVSASAMDSVEDVLGAIGHVMGVSDQEVRSRLSSRRYLVVLDGLDESPRPIELEHFLAMVPYPSKTLVTSRNRSILPTQSVVFTLGGLTAKAATELLTMMAASYGLKVSHEARLRFKEIAADLHYHPLALALVARLTIGDERSVSDLLLDSGRSFVRQGRWYDGLRLLQWSLSIRRQGDNLDARADAIYEIARVHHLMGNLDKARMSYRDALRLYEHANNQRGVAACKTGLGRLAIQIGLPFDAIQESGQAYRIYSELGETQRANEVKEILDLANHIKEKQPA
jgi:hypothetical protein